MPPCSHFCPPSPFHVSLAPTSTWEGQGSLVRGFKFLSQSICLAFISHDITCEGAKRSPEGQRPIPHMSLASGTPLSCWLAQSQEWPQVARDHMKFECNGAILSPSRSFSILGDAALLVRRAQSCRERSGTMKRAAGQHGLI